MSDVLASVSASLGRRVFGLATLLALGGGLIYLALATPPQSILWQGFLLVFGGVVLWLADRLRRATEQSIVLTEEGLFDSQGQVLAHIDNIVGVERGPFAIKPSNGFMVRLKTRQPRAWAPGLWWRTGRRVGVGGVTSAGQSKFMAETLTALLVEKGVMR